MKIAYNPKSGAALQTAPDNNDITFDLAGKTIYARGEGFKGTDTTYDIFRKASESVGGLNGLVPAPDYNSDSKNRFLKEDGTWVIPNAGTLNGYPESNFFRYRGDINSAYVDLTNYEKNAENFASYNPGMYNIPKNGHSELFINFAKNIGSTSSLELKTSYNNDDYLYIRKVIDNNRVSGAWRPLAFADNTVRSVTLNNNLLRINTNGTNNDLTIPYATNTSNIISSKLENSNSYGSETGISWSLASSTNNGTYGTAIDSNGFNVNNNANGILWLGTHKASTNGGYGGQLGISSNSNIYYRYISNGSFPNAWNKIVFERDLTALNIKLTGYLLDTDNFESITSNDTVSSALSKLECKTLFVYDWLMFDADDADEKINKWHEVEHFLEGIEETTLNSILNTKAAKATTLAGYGITDAVKYCYGADDIRHSASGYAQTTHGGKVNGMLLSGIYAETSLYGGQLNGAFDGSSIWYRGLNNGTFTEWKRIAFTDDVVTLNTNQTISGVKTLSANLLSATRGTLDIGDEYNSFNRIFAWHYKPNSLTKPILSSGKWYRIWNFSQGVAGTFQKNAIISINKAYSYEQGQTITLAVSINNWGQTYVINQLSGTTGLITKVRVTGKWNYSYVDVYISSAENAELYSVSGYGNGERVDFEELADDATNDSTRTEELTVVNGTAVNYPLSLQNATPLVVNSTTMVANLNANYLGGLNKNSFQKAVYDYINVSGTADTTALPTVLAPCNYNGTASLDGNFKFYDTKFYGSQTKTSNRCQLAYGYDVDSIHFRRYSGGKWNDWKKVVFTEGTDNLKITNSSARTTYVKDSTHSMFFGYSDGSYNRGLYDNSLSNWIMYTDSSNQTFINQWLGNVGIKTGNATLTAALQVGGSILASGDITAYSDRRLKSNIQTLENRGYVEPVTFEKDGKQCIGFIAQDVEEKYPELVNSEGEYLSLNYQQYTAVLQALIIELDKRIKELENGFSKL